MKTYFMLIIVCLILVSCAATKVSVLEIEELKSVNLPNGFQKGTDKKGEIVIIDGITNLNVIATFPPNKGVGTVIVPINKKYKTFETGISSLRGDVVFFVKGDKKRLFRSRKMNPDNSPTNISINIENIDVLELGIEPFGYAPGDNPIWINPTLIK